MNIVWTIDGAVRPIGSRHQPEPQPPGPSTKGLPAPSKAPIRKSRSASHTSGKSEKPWTKTLWVYDLRTNKHFTLKTRRMVRSDLDEFVECYHPGTRQKRTPTWSEKSPEGRWRAFTHEEILERDKASLDLFWLRDESLEDSASLPEPHVLAEEIAEDLRASLEQIEDVLADLQARANSR